MKVRLVPTVLALLASLGSARPAAPAEPLPYRFLLVISDQWKDPASYIIESGGEFPAIVTLLKNWGLPFDVLRLDQQRFDPYYLLDREGRPRYGTVIWDGDPAAMQDKDLSLLAPLVREHGLGLVVLGDSVATPQLSALAGVTYVSDYRLPDGLSFSGDHFITRGFAARAQELGGGNYVAGNKVTVQDASVAARRAHLPFLTTRQAGAGRVAWLGAHRPTAQIARQVVRDLFKRSLVWAQGYALYAEYPRSMILFMDDFGTSDRTYLPYWHYRTLNEEDIRKGIIEPLKKHKAYLMQDVVSGYVDRKGRRIVSPWKQQVIDEIDGKTMHDYVSAKRGLDAGLREGVLEIQCHGYTHMLPDLDSPPGPFWTAPMDGAGTLGFDEEFSDRLRNRETPAIIQRFFLDRALDYIRRDFGVRPLFVINGGGGWSKSYPHSSARIAAEMGFGLSNFGTPGYLGRDLVIAMEQIAQRGSWAHDRKLTGAEIPWTIDAPYFLIFHDRDVSLDPNAVERLLANLGGGIRYMTADEYTGYLHARVERAPEGQGPVALALTYDEHYCRYFANHESAWVLHLSDETRRAAGSAVPERRTVRIPRGLGTRVVGLNGVK